MWQEILSNVLKNGTTAPQQIEPEKQDNNTLFLYGFAVVVLGIVVYFLTKSFSK